MDNYLCNYGEYETSYPRMYEVDAIPMSSNEPYQGGYTYQGFDYMSNDPFSEFDSFYDTYDQEWMGDSHLDYKVQDYSISNFVSNEENVDYMSNGPYPPYDSYYDTYALEWGNYSDLEWESQEPYSQYSYQEFQPNHPPQPLRYNSLPPSQEAQENDDFIKRLVQQSEVRRQANVATLKSMENHIEQILKYLSEKPQSVSPSNIETNLKEHIETTILESEPQAIELEVETQVEEIVTRDDGVEKLVEKTFEEDDEVEELVVESDKEVKQLEEQAEKLPKEEGKKEDKCDESSQLLQDLKPISP